MKLERLRVGDEIEANVRGRRFTAIVEDLADPNCAYRKPVRVSPLSRNVTDRYLSPRQIVRRLHRGPRQLELA